MNTARSLLYVVWLYGAIALVGLAFAPAAIFDRNATYAAMRWCAKICLFGLKWICGAEVRIEGRENIPEGAVLLAMKHQAMLDVFLPSLLFDRPAIVFKSELRRAPLWGWYLDRGKMIPVARETQAAALKTMLRAAREAAADGRAIAIFPEGTRQKPGAKPRYKPGVAALYRDLSLHCVPVALNSGLVWPAKGLTRKPGVVTVRILPAIPPGLSRDDFMRELETRIETASTDLLPPHLQPSKPA